MPVGTTAAIIGGGSLLGGIFGSSSASKAAKAQAAAAAEAARVQKEMYEQTRRDLSPYRDFGGQSTNALNDAYGFNGQQGYDRSFANFRADPGYDYARNEAIKAASTSAAARGSLFSGPVLRGITDRTFGLADQGYGNWLGRYQQGQSLGQNAAAQTGNFGAQSAAQQGQYITDGGAAKAAGYAGQANAFSSAFNNGLGAYLYGKGSGAFS